MTATPHKGDPENFCLFLELLDRDVYGSVKSLEEAMRRHHAPFYLRRTKEALVSFPDPETGEVKKLFTKREVRTRLFRARWRRVRFLRRAHPVRRGPVHQGVRGRQRPRPCSRLHNGDAPAPLRFQRLRRAPQPRAHARQAAEDPRRPGEVPDRSRSRIGCRTTSTICPRTSSMEIEASSKGWSPPSIQPRCARRFSGSASSSSRRALSNGARSRSKLREAEEGPFGQQRLQRPEA